MKIGIVGLGRMGASLALRLVRGGHECVIYDLDPKLVDQLEGSGCQGVYSLRDLAESLPSPKIIWLMIPAGAVGEELEHITPLLSPGDILIDGGNSNYRDDIRRGKALSAMGIHYLDVGTSGGVAGLERGFCLMIGGSAEAVAVLTPIFATLAPGKNAATPTSARNNPFSTADQGYFHCGPQGAGHFVKMVHNGIEYGLMEAYAEGLNVLYHANAGNNPRSADAETTPLPTPEFYAYDFDIAEIAEVWRRGSVISSWLLDLAAEALAEDGELSGFEGIVSDSGEGRWTLTAAIDEGVPVPVISSAVFERFNSQGSAAFALKALSAMRKEFGGHREKKAEGDKNVSR